MNQIPARSWRPPALRHRRALRRRKDAPGVVAGGAINLPETPITRPRVTPHSGTLGSGLDLDAASGFHDGCMNERAPAIEIRGLATSFGDNRVITGVDLAVTEGTNIALLGSNGAGKTTIVKILSTLLKADGGTATVNGFDVATQAAKVRESISLTGQFAAVDEVLSGRENLVLVARLRHLESPGTIADELLARFSLTDAGGRRVATYSGGQCCVKRSQAHGAADLPVRAMNCPPNAPPRPWFQADRTAAWAPDATANRRSPAPR
jgi:ABC-type glutathione transport system ATPase component